MGLGYKYSQSRAVLAQTLLMKIYHEKYPKCIHKCPKQDKESWINTCEPIHREHICNKQYAQKPSSPTLVMTSKNKINNWKSIPRNKKMLYGPHIFWPN